MDGFDFSNLISGIQVPKFDMPEIDPLPIVYAYSDTQYEIIKKHVEKFQSELDPDHEVGVLLTNFGQSTLMHVTNIGYEESVLMVFKGYVNNQESTLIQHISQINFLLLAVPKAEPEKPARRIGFDTSQCI